MDDTGAPGGDVALGQAVLTDAVRAYRDAFGDRLVAAYALGSLAHGGFSALVSDVDLAVVLADPLGSSDGVMIQRVADQVREHGSVLHERLSVFWGTPSTLGGREAGGRLPPLDRLDLLEHGRLLHGQDARTGVPRPTLPELLVAGAEFALDFLAGGRSTAGTTGRGLGSMRSAEPNAVDQIRRPDLLVARGVRHATKVAIFPVRFLYTARTGAVGTNESAAAHYLGGGDPPGDPPGARLVAQALAWRTVPPDPAEAEALLRREVIPLYLHYIDDHIARLTASDRLDLAQEFEKWRDRLVG